VRKVALAVCLVLAVSGGPAWAMSEANQKLLKEHYDGLGEVRYALFAPLGGPEIGAAVIGGTVLPGGGVQGAQLWVMRVEKGGTLTTLLNEPLSTFTKRAPFTFLLTGRHLLTYPTAEWVDGRGLSHRRGDLTIRNLEAEGGPKIVYQLRDVVDLSFQAGGALSGDNLLWQPVVHFLNTGARLPVRNVYFSLTLDSAKGEYKLSRHLTCLPDAATVDAANLNNRAVYCYSEGWLSDATRLLEQASVVSEADQSVISHNQAMIRSELTDLAEQGNLLPDRRFDEALMYFWQGDFAACLRVLDARRHTGLGDDDLAMSGIALACVRRWPEVDRVTVELEHRAYAQLADYLAELVRVALRQGFFDVASTYLRALEAVDKRHPAYAALYATLLARMGNTADAENLLEQYLAAHPGGSVNAMPRYQLFQLYKGRGNEAGCQTLIADALVGPVFDLMGYVELADYFDFSSALIPVPAEERERLQMPDHPLDQLEIN